MRYVIGIDSGLWNIGVCLYDTFDDKVIDYGMQGLSRQTKSYAEYYDLFSATLDDYVSKMDTKDAIVIFEKTKSNIYKIVGIQQCICEQKKLPFKEISAIRVKNLFTKNPRASKQDMMDKVKERFNIVVPYKDNHITDAIGIACAFSIETR